MRETLYPLLAALLSYPGEDLLATAEQARTALQTSHSEASELVARFAAEVAGRSSWENEELYARLFDLAPTRCMDLGYQVFGETYRRGGFLVKMKAAAVAHGISAGVELFDHLTVALRLLPRLDDAEEPYDLVNEVMVPVVHKLLATFEDDGGGYRHLFEAVLSVLMADYHIDTPAALPAQRPDAAPDGSSKDARRLPMFPGFQERSFA